MTELALKISEQAGRPGRGRPRDRSKHRAILDAAIVLFLQHGYDATSMDEVAKLAGVSKQTVYSHFEGKEGLFIAAVRMKIDEHRVQDALNALESRTLEADLIAVASTYGRLLMSSEAIAMFRLLASSASSASKGPDLAQKFWDAGPAVMLEDFENFLKGFVDSGDLAIPDLRVAATQMIALLKGELHFRLSIGLEHLVDEATFNEHILMCVDMFLTRYRAKKA